MSLGSTTTPDTFPRRAQGAKALATERDPGGHSQSTFCSGSQHQTITDCTTRLTHSSLHALPSRLHAHTSVLCSPRSSDGEGGSVPHFHPMRCRWRHSSFLTKTEEARKSGSLRKAKPRSMVCSQMTNSACRDRLPSV